MNGTKTARVCAAALATACVTVFPPPAVAATTHRLTVTGAGSGFADVTFDETTAVDLTRATIEGGGSSYVGVLLTRLDSLDREDSLLVIQFPSANPGNEPPAVLGHVRTGLTAGAYRVYLLSDGPATVTFPVAGLRRDVVLPVAAATTPRLRVTDVPTPLAPGIDGLYRGENRHPFVVDGHRIAIYRLVAEFGVGLVEKHGADACDTEQGNTCEPPPGVFVLRNRGTSPDRWYVTGYVPRDLWPAGTYDVYATCYALQPIATCRVVTLDEFVSTAPADVRLRIPGGPATTATRATGTPPGAAPRDRAGGAIPATGLPAAVAALATALTAGAFALRRRR